MNFRMFFLQLISVLFMTQIDIFTMYSASPVALRSFRTMPAASGFTLRNDGSMGNVQEGWASRLERMMNPQGFNVGRSVDNQLPQAVLNPSVFKDVIPLSNTSIQSSQSNSVASGNSEGAAYLKSLRADPNFVASMLKNMNQAALNRGSVGISPEFDADKFATLINKNYLEQLKVKMAETLLFEDFHQRLMFEAQNLSTLTDRDAVQWYIMKNEELNQLVNNFEYYDISLQKKVASLQNSIALRIDSLQMVIEFEENMKASAQADKEAAENRAYIRNGFGLPSEEGQIPVEAPYEQVKQDVKGQFYRGAALGGVGAGTLYGLQKRNKRK